MVAPLEIVLYIQTDRDIYCILRQSVQVLYYFPQIAIYFIILSFLVQIMFFIKQTLKFKYPPHCLKVKRLCIWSISFFFKVIREIKDNN